MLNLIRGVIFCIWFCRNLEIHLTKGSQFLTLTLTLRHFADGHLQNFSKSGKNLRFLSNFYLNLFIFWCDRLACLVKTHSISHFQTHTAFIINQRALHNKNCWHAFASHCRYNNTVRAWIQNIRILNPFENRTF